MSWPLRIVRYAIAFLVAAAVTYVLAAWFYTELVLAELASVGVEIPIGVHFTNTWDNIVGLSDSAFGSFWGTYAGVILVGLLLAFAVAFYVKLHANPLQLIVGGVGVGVVVAAAANQIFGLGRIEAVIAGVIAIPAAAGLNLLVTRWLPFLERIAYPVAGAAAVGLVLYSIGWALGAAAMAGAREPGGFVLQMLAGLIGGVVFAALRPVGEPTPAAPATAEAAPAAN